jgi:hypothetical protein
MSTALELVYRYRQLAGKCDVCGLSMDEILLMDTIESLFREGGQHARKFARERVAIDATLRGRKHTDTIRINDLAPGGLECIRAPYYEAGDEVEVVIKDEECSLSYRFKAVVTWMREENDSDDYRMGLKFVGAPVLLSYAPSRDEAAVAEAA